MEPSNREFAVSGDHPVDLIDDKSEHIEKDT